MPMGREAPWRGRRMTRTSWQKYLPPNCAPMPVSWLSCSTFCSSSKLKQAVCAFTASQLIHKHEKDVIDGLFRAMDTSCDGKLSREELKVGYADYMGKELTEEEVNDIFQRVNYSCSGAIEYSEFVVASIELDEYRIRATFNEFHKRGCDALDADDLKQ